MTARIEKWSHREIAFKLVSVVSVAGFGLLAGLAASAFALGFSPLPGTTSATWAFGAVLWGGLGGGLLVFLLADLLLPPANRMAPPASGLNRRVHGEPGDGRSGDPLGRTLGVRRIPRRSRGHNV